MNTEQELLDIYNKATKLYELGIVEEEDLDKMWDLYKKHRIQNKIAKIILDKPFDLTEEEFHKGSEQLCRKLESGGLDLSKFEG